MCQLAPILGTEVPTSVALDTRESLRAPTPIVSEADRVTGCADGSAWWQPGGLTGHVCVEVESTPASASAFVLVAASSSSTSAVLAGVLALLRLDKLSLELLDVSGLPSIFLRTSGRRAS